MVQTVLQARGVSEITIRRALRVSKPPEERDLVWVPYASLTTQLYEVIERISPLILRHYGSSSSWKLIPTYWKSVMRQASATARGSLSVLANSLEHRHRPQADLNREATVSRVLATSTSPAGCSISTWASRFGQST